MRKDGRKKEGRWDEKKEGRKIDNELHLKKMKEKKGKEV